MTRLRPLTEIERVERAIEKARWLNRVFMAALFLVAVALLCVVGIHMAGKF